MPGSDFCSATLLSLPTQCDAFRHAHCAIVHMKGGDAMEYNVALFNAITDALATLEQAKAILIAAQQDAEEIYMESADET